MLKRYQVLLSEWMEEYMKLVAEKYDLSSSAVIRTHLGIAILYIIYTLYPEYKPNSLDKELSGLFKKISKSEIKKEEVLQTMSRILFEARKAVEYRLSKEKKSKK